MKKKILLVSRDKSIFDGISSALGLRTQAGLAWDGRAADALKVLASKTIDLVIVHEDLPDMSCRVFVEKLVQTNPFTDCVVVSGLSAGEFHEVYEGLGVVMQFADPPKQESLDALVDHLDRIASIAGGQDISGGAVGI